MHTISFDSSYVRSTVGTTIITGTSREGRALSVALETDVRNNLLPVASNTDPVGLRVIIDGSSIPNIQLHKRIAFRPFLYLPTGGGGGGGSCETSCGSSTGNNETCPTATYLDIVGIPDTTTGSLPRIRQIAGSSAYGIFHVDVNPTEDSSNNQQCGVTYEPGDHTGVSSTVIILSLRNIVLSHCSLLPAVGVTTFRNIGSSSSSDLRTVSLLLSGVSLLSNDASSLFIQARDSDVILSMNDTVFRNNKNMQALAMRAEGSVQLVAKLDNCTFASNQSPLPGTALSFLSPSFTSRHQLSVTRTIFSGNRVDSGDSDTSACQLFIRTDSTAAMQSQLSTTTFGLTPLPRACAVRTVTVCPPGAGVARLGSCTPCSVGSYSLGGSESSCVLCTAGQYASSMGALSCTKCAAGQTSSGSVVSGVGSGGYQGGTGCVECERGTYSDTMGAASCASCSPGLYTVVSGARECLRCTRGTFDPSGPRKGGTSTICQECSMGTYAAQDGATSCISCSLGMYASTEGSFSCVACSVGFYANKVSSTECMECEKEKNQVTQSKDGTRNSTFVGSVACVDVLPSPAPSATADLDFPLVIVIVVVGVIVISFTVCMGCWVRNSKERRRARMVNPSFPAAGEEGTEMAGQQAETTPASIIQDQFRIHDLDHDGHIDADELTNLIREIVGLEMWSEDAFQQISSILLAAVDTDGNGTLERDEFTMLCLRVMRWPATDVDSRLSRMVPNTNEEERNLLKIFFYHMNRWFMRKLSVLRNLEERTPDGSFDPAEENDLRQAEEAGPFETWSS